MSDKPVAPDGFLARWSRRKVGVREGGTLPPEPAHAATTSTPARAELGQAPPAASASFDRLRTNGDATTGLTPVRPEPVEGAASIGASTSPIRTDAGMGDGAPLPVPAAPTLDDVAALSRDADFRRFVAPDVAPEVKNAAMKKLFTDPHFNVMDGLDTYIDDYGKPDPIPASMLRQLVQSHALGLFADEPENDVAGAPAARASPDGAAAPEPAQSGTEDPAALSALAADDHHPALRLQPLHAAGPPGDPGSAGQDPGRER